jgi:hypothetical protein
MSADPGLSRTSAIIGDLKAEKRSIGVLIAPVIALIVAHYANRHANRSCYMIPGIPEMVGTLILKVYNLE